MQIFRAGKERVRSQSMAAGALSDDLTAVGDALRGLDVAGAQSTASKPVAMKRFHSAPTGGKARSPSTANFATDQSLLRALASIDDGEDDDEEEECQDDV